MQKRAQFRVDGLGCAEEVLLLEQAIQDRPGIQQLAFDVLNARMSVTFDDKVTSSKTIMQLVLKTGMQAHPWHAAGSDEPKQRVMTNRRFVITSVAGLLLTIGFASHVWETSLLQALRGQAVPFVAQVFFAGSILAGIWLVVPKALVSLRYGHPDMNLLMSVAVAGAIVLGEWFEAATITFLFAVALLLEQWSLGRTRRAISTLLDLSPPTARRVDPSSGEIRELLVEDVEVGSTISVRPGERIPLDGSVTKGESSVNEAAITGESNFVPKQPGAPLFAGTVNEGGVLEFEVLKPASDTTLARIVHMVQDAHARRASSEQWVEKFARRYTPLMMALAVAVIPPLLFSAGWETWVYRGLVVLVIACPCALVISTPVSIFCGLASAARHGVLVKGGKHLESVAHLRAIALDKTGTLTFGRPVVQQIVPFNGHTKSELLERAAAMESHSQHPLARAILYRAEKEHIVFTQADEFRLLSGKGAEAIFFGKPFWIGSHRLMHEKGEETPEVHDRAVEMEDAGHSVVAIGNAEHVCGLISMADNVRDGAPILVAQLKQFGVRHVCMLTGDNEETARAVAEVTGVDEYRSEFLPEDKVCEIEQLRKRYGTVGMVGDGVNDAPAMAVSSLGIAMGAAGTDTAIETADVALMSDDLSKIPWLIAHARRTLSIVKQNIAFALGLKLLFVVLTLVGAASLWMAIVTDTGASLLVIFNGLRLLKA